jgi:mannosyltransferase OCH1-like enzyme
MESWKEHLPDYKIKRWTTENFDINSVRLVKEACEAKKWAFAADYIRLYALYNEGGIYLDSDVMIYKNLTPLFDAKFVSAIEYHPAKKDKLLLNKIYLDENGNRISVEKKVPGIGIQAAIICSKPKHAFLKETMDFYQDKTLDFIMSNKLTIPTVLALTAEKYGFRYKDEEQRLSNDIHLYNSTCLSNYDQFSDKSYAVHFCDGSWTNNSLQKNIIRFVKSNGQLFALYNRIKKITTSI